MKLKMFELSQDLPIVMSIGTLVTVLWAVINYTSKLASYKKEMEMKCHEMDERLNKLEELDLDSRLREMAIDLKRIREQMKK